MLAPRPPSTASPKFKGIDMLWPVGTMVISIGAEQAARRVRIGEARKLGNALVGVNILCLLYELSINANICKVCGRVVFYLTNIAKFS